MHTFRGDYVADIPWSLGTHPLIGQAVVDLGNFTVLDQHAGVEADVPMTE